MRTHPSRFRTFKKGFMRCSCISPMPLLSLILFISFIPLSQQSIECDDFTDCNISVCFCNRFRFCLGLGATCKCLLCGMMLNHSSVTTGKKLNVNMIYGTWSDKKSHGVQARSLLHKRIHTFRTYVCCGVNLMHRRCDCKIGHPKLFWCLLGCFSTQKPSLRFRSPWK